MRFLMPKNRRVSEASTFSRFPIRTVMENDILKSMADMQAYAHHLTEFKNLFRDGSAANVG